jgi:formate dehydrogenase major subunit
MLQISLNGTQYESVAGDRLIDVISRAGTELSQVCYHPQLGPIQTLRSNASPEDKYGQRNP